MIRSMTLYFDESIVPNVPGTHIITFPLETSGGTVYFDIDLNHVIVKGDSFRVEGEDKTMIPMKNAKGKVIGKLSWGAICTKHMLNRIRKEQQQKDADDDVVIFLDEGTLTDDEIHSV